MDAAIDWNLKQGYRILLVVMTNSEAAIRLYERTGWIKFGETKHVLQSGWYLHMQRGQVALAREACSRPVYCLC